MNQALKASLLKMQVAGCDDRSLLAFSRAFNALRAGNRGLLAERSLASLPLVPTLANVSVSDERARDALSKTVVIKLNGGLGTNMGLSGTKTLLIARDKLTMLDLIVAQVRSVRQRYDVRLPLLFMDSFRTSNETLEYLSNFDDIAVTGLPLDFLQTKEPKLYAGTLLPAEWPDDAELEWCPPGHGDLYPAMLRSGLLEQLLSAGYEYAFISNGDNLGASPAAQVAGWFADSGATFGMEVCRRSSNDRKGGHLALRRSDNRMVLRELAQTSADDMEYFSDIHLYPWFNTNSIWLHLPSLAIQLEKYDAVLPLPLIVNEKPLDPAIPDSPTVYQLESALGAAIELFDSAVVDVGRERFIPVKSTADLLLLRSDCYELLPDATLRATVNSLPVVSLDPEYYRNVCDFDARFRAIPPLAGLSEFIVNGDQTFD
ncbi:MAG: UTP--glucose-1-phosphate uridylyltransferase [Propionibacteriaceae bacterium]|nr:UTP--glucose-1-phosphate uridylyltransferase [Propionibacteriaceae bacterium]